MTEDQLLEALCDALDRATTGTRKNDFVPLHELMSTHGPECRVLLQAHCPAFQAFPESIEDLLGNALPAEPVPGKELYAHD